MKKTLCIIISATLLFGCATSQMWTSTSKTDEFTDITTKTVSMNFYMGAYGMNNMTFFVSSRTNQVFLGVRSQMGIPVGTVQIRIDQNPTITISPTETPVYLAPQLPSVPKNPYVNTDQMMASALAAASPFTATTGDKAQEILKQMIHGHLLIFRTVGINQAASTTGSVKIDSSFLSALKSIGIEPQNFQ